MTDFLKSEYPTILAYVESGVPFEERTDVNADIAKYVCFSKSPEKLSCYL
jgi:hypothetical protein